MPFIVQLNDDYSFIKNSLNYDVLYYLLKNCTEDCIPASFDNIKPYICDEMINDYLLMDIYDRNQFEIDTGKIYTIYFGGNYKKSLLDSDDEWVSGNSDQTKRRLIYSVINIPNHPDIILKITPDKNQDSNIKTVVDLINNGLIENNHSFDIKNEYLFEIVISQICSNINNTDFYLKRLNNGYNLFPNFYGCRYVTEQNNSIKFDINDEVIIINNVSNDLEQSNNGRFLISIMEDLKLYTNMKLAFKYHSNNYGDINKLIYIKHYLYKTYNFAHWDLHKNNFMINYKTAASYIIFDFDRSIIKNYYSDNNIKYEHPSFVKYFDVITANRINSKKDRLSLMGHIRDISKLIDWYNKEDITNNLLNYIREYISNNLGIKYEKSEDCALYTLGIIYLFTYDKEFSYMKDKFIGFGKNEIERNAIKRTILDVQTELIPEYYVLFGLLYSMISWY